MKNNNFNLEEKDIYKLFNGIKIEESEFEDMDREISTIEKERIKKNLNKKIKNKKNLKIVKYGSIAAAVTLACTIGLGTAYPTFAKDIPVLGSIIQTLNGRYGDSGEYEKYSEVIDKSITDKGITVTINEVLADDYKLIIGYTIKSDEKIKDLEVFNLNSFLKINGKGFCGSGSATGKYIDDYTYVGSEETNINLFKAPKNFNVDLKIRDILGKKGKWNFAFSVSREDIVKNSITFNPNKKIDFPDAIVNIDKTVFSPVGTYISLSGNYKDENGGQNPSNIFEYDYWIAFDDKGVELAPIGIGGGTSNNKNFNSQMNYTKVKDIPKYLTIIPCKITPSAGGGVSVDKDSKEIHQTIKTKKPKEISKIIDGKYPIELNQGKFGKLVIKEINTKGDTTTVKFIALGKTPHFQAGSLYIKDENGERINFKDHYDIRRNEENPNEFEIDFEALNKNKKYSICTDDFSNVEFREDLKFKIELK
ncbi:DUF4179 domain-containing protein [Clostridium tetani]|uniref:DUF4179 domain-containing protein n=1 Tax=Clostridium tetani TaxID=1513 RepID=UPI00100B804D|nr:DUF4179 domain-containing protein [Clostridium tetani]RXI45820.1 DUF4179 domain-containing protein [Clostridium tetani]RXM61212.1 DUF4179 domain-containing protein [Clostridium tetani]RXM70036.1 DUF4179 domain-containing protein [Clostridium tetani]